MLQARFLRVSLLLLIVAVPTAAFAQSTPVSLDQSDIYAKSLKALTILLVLAVLVENALAVIFNWRVFLSYFSLRGMRTVIMVAVSYLLVMVLDVDVIDRLLAAYQPDRGADSSFLTQALTALIIAGGSSGVHNVMFALGYRDSRREQEVDPSPPVDKAWVAVRVRRENSIGPVHVEITEDPNAPADLPAIAGTCLAARPGLLSLLLRNTNRFPANGGHEVRPGVAYNITISGRDRDDKKLDKSVSEGPVKFTAGAIVDFQASL